MKHHLLSFFLVSSSALAVPNAMMKESELLIHELKDVRSETEKNSEIYIELTQRLATIIFDESIVESSDQKIISFRNQAIKYYQELIEFYSNQDEQKEYDKQIQTYYFQIARLENKLFRYQKAEQAFQHVLSFKTKNQPIIYETHLNLAEIYDNEGELDQSFQHYENALAITKENEQISYIYQKQAWIYYKKNQTPEAVSFILKSIDTVGIRNNPNLMDDFILFATQSSEKIDDIVSYVKKYSQQLGRDYLAPLAEAYLSFGNNQAAVIVLQDYLNQNKDFYYKLRLMEEKIGLKDFKGFAEETIDLNQNFTLYIDAEKDSKNSYLTLSRMLVQVLAFKGKSHKESYLLDLIEIFLKKYPQDKNQLKMQISYLKNNSDTKMSYDKLVKWFIPWADTESDRKVLHYERIILARKLKNDDGVRESAQFLSQYYQTSEKDLKLKREFDYMVAKTYLDQNKLDQAKIIFRNLVFPQNEEFVPDKYILLSFNLFLDILNKQKNYAQIVSKIELFRDQSLPQKISISKKEMGQIDLIQDQARFESALVASNKLDSIETFKEYCYQGKFIPQSCDNLKILIVQENQQQELITFLKFKNDESALQNEYELMGEFSLAADLKLKKNKIHHKAIDVNKIDQWLHIALLYELDFNQEQVVKTLKQIKSSLIKSKLKVDETREGILYAYFHDYQLLDQKCYKINWTSPKIKLNLTKRFLLEEYSDKKKISSHLAKRSQKMQVSLNEVFDSHLYKKLFKSYERITRYNFHGNNSKRRFQRKLRMIEKLAKRIDTQIEKLTVTSRIAVLNLIKLSYENLAENIANTPIPEGLDQATLTQVNQQITQMQQPYIKTANEYFALMKEAIDKLDPLIKEELVSASMQPESFIQYLDSIIAQKYKDQADKYSEIADHSQVNQYLELKAGKSQQVLKKEELVQLKSLVGKLNKKRLVHYYDQRIGL